ncbi:hypothetical protein SAMN02745121_08500 [Nannocystis exedens]|uniref:Uncharacterized protein n=1 Tax=Nannocystis exedens TaxID=54 RepID=A0A1I2IBJ8_9BACT|nr:hypothetical protein [Nannocystis exedens]PCC74117.1 hypothetical protein NAEX_07206 [Nannocystis exedens]SFF38216.1 hypothetical protein SAMN02745121_08500 [Nannocystis exedens]
MTLNFLSILPLAALTLGACTLETKLLGDPNFDSATDSDSDGSTEDATSSSASAGSSDGSGSSTTSAGSSDGSSSSTTSAGSSDGSSSSTTSAGSDTDQTGTSSSSTLGPEETSSSSSGTSTGPEPQETSSTSEGTTLGPEQTASSSASDTDQTGTSSSSGVETSGGQLCEDPPLDAPGVDRGCQADEDCIVVFHQTDCCGTVDAYSVNTQSADAYAIAAAPCTFEPFCDCAPESTDAEDGEATADKDQIVAVCIDNVCRSAVP